MKFEWNLPNALTLLRIALVPAIGACLIVDTALSLSIGLVLFGLSALTDALDGAIARKLHLESEFGAYIDPLADKVLVSAVFLLFSLKPGLHVFWWMTAIIIARDILVTALRNRSKRLGIEFKTSFVAKAKTATQMISIALIMIYLFLVRFVSAQAVPAKTAYDSALQAILPGTKLIYTPFLLTAAVTLFTMYTAIDYVVSYVKKRRLMKDGAGKK